MAASIHMDQLLLISASGEIRFYHTRVRRGTGKAGDWCLFTGSPRGLCSTFLEFLPAGEIPEVSKLFERDISRS